MKKINIYSFEFVKKSWRTVFVIVFWKWDENENTFRNFFANNDKAVESVEKGPKIALKKNRKNTLIF